MVMVDGVDRSVLVELLWEASAKDKKDAELVLL
jgi:hypothetical protein